MATGQRKGGGGQKGGGGMQFGAAPKKGPLGRIKLIKVPAGALKQRKEEQAVIERPARFFNPYTFTPPVSREGLAAGSFAGDYDPVAGGEDHSRYHPSLYSGTLRLQLTVKTPLVLPAPNPEVDNATGHKTYRCLDQVAATAIKGVLSSAYEVITNSRLRVFNVKEHEKRLGYRPAARASLVPARVHQQGDDWALEYFPGASGISVQGAVRAGVHPTALYAAWLPRDMGAQARTGDTGHAWLVLCRHRNKYLEDDSWCFWRVVAFDTTSLPAKPDESRLRSLFNPTQSKWRYEAREDEPLQMLPVQGLVVKTGKMISSKHDERLFFQHGTAPARKVLTPAVVDEYNALLKDYQDIHKGDAYPPDKRKDCVHGAHITQAGKVLQDGDFVYAEVADAATLGVRAIYPVQISRKRHPLPVTGLLPAKDRLLPAVAIPELSPADRLFGWVSQTRQDRQPEQNPQPSGWRGKLRITGVRMQPPEGQASPLTVFQSTVPLAILGQPKPAQARFYLRNTKGKPQAAGISKEQAGYTQGKQLGLRKFYWRAEAVVNTPDYWANPWEDRSGEPPVNGHYQEYRQMEAPPGGEYETRSKQNRSIRGWIAQGTTMTFTVRLENVTQEELGALVLLARLNAEPGAGACYHMMGYGKPLGLGCVQLGLACGDAIQMAANTNLADRYTTLQAHPVTACLSKTDLNEAVNAYKDAMRAAYPAQEWAGIPFIKAYLQVLMGPAGQDQDPVHYPRNKAKRRWKEGNVEKFALGYEWFVANERIQRNVLPGHSLPDIFSTEGLPYDI